MIEAYVEGRPIPVFSNNFTIEDSLYGSGGWDTLSVQEHSNNLYSFLNSTILLLSSFSSLSPLRLYARNPWNLISFCFVLKYPILFVLELVNLIEFTLYIAGYICDWIVLS